MTHTKAKRLYPAYSDGLLDRDDRSSVDRHLGTCERCRTAYDLLGRALGPGSALPRRLPVDPYLPARIRAIAAAQRPPRRPVLAPVLRWSFGSLAFALALMLGIYLGRALLPPTSQTGTDDSISEFAASLAELDLGDRWLLAMDQNGGAER